MRGGASGTHRTDRLGLPVADNNGQSLFYAPCRRVIAAVCPGCRRGFLLTPRIVMRARASNRAGTRLFAETRRTLEMLNNPGIPGFRLMQSRFASYHRVAVSTLGRASPTTRHRAGSLSRLGHMPHTWDDRDNECWDLRKGVLTPDFMPLFGWMGLRDPGIRHALVEFGDTVSTLRTWIEKSQQPGRRTSACQAVSLSPFAVATARRTRSARGCTPRPGPRPNPADIVRSTRETCGSSRDPGG